MLINVSTPLSILHILPPLLHVQLILAVGQGEHPQLAARPLGACGEDVRHQQRQATIVVQPPDINRALQRDASHVTYMLLLGGNVS